jgi:integrator complex subunit 7
MLFLIEEQHVGLLFAIKLNYSPHTLLHLMLSLLTRLFALSMCNKISDMIQGLATPAHMKLQLIPILQHMHHDTSTAAMVRRLCTDLLPSYPAEEFVLVTLNSLTQLASATLVDIPNQVRYMIWFN